MAAQPAAMAALRQASLELSPSWRAAREAAQRIQTDHDRIARVLATHPHPDPADRAPKARAAAYTGQISQGIRDRREAVEAAQAQAATAMARCSRLTRALAAVGISTHEQREAVRLAQHATALADKAERAVSGDDWKHAKSTGEAHAYAAQKSTRTWEARPDVAQAVDDARLNAVVKQAIRDGDPAIQEAMDAGNPNAARAIIRNREQVEERKLAKADQLADLARGLLGPSGSSPLTPGKM